MHTKVMILLWERWKRTRWAVIAASLLPFIGSLMYVTDYTTLETAVNVTKTFWCLGFLLLTFILLVSHCEARDLDLSFPKRLFRFPVSTTTLFGAYMGYGVATVALQFLVIFSFEKLFLDTTSYGWTHLLWFEAVYIVMQALSWLSWLVESRIRFLCLSSALTFLYGYSVLIFINSNNMFTGNGILCPIIIVLFSVIAFWSISAHRHSDGISNWQWVDSLFGIFRRKPPKRFASALQAQTWFEMRQTGRLFPFAALSIVVILLCWWVLVFRPTPLFSAFVPTMFWVAIPTADIAGFLVFGVYNRHHVSGESSFWLRCPIATRTLAVARLQAMLLSLVYVLGILTVVTLAVAAYDYSMGTQHIATRLSPVKWALEYNSSSEAVTMTLLGLYGFVVFYWTLLRLAPILMVAGVALFLISWLTKLLIGDPAFFLVGYSLVVGLPLGVLGAFYITRRRNLITTATLVIAACMFPLVVVSLWAFPWWSLTGNMYLKGLHSLSLNQIILMVIVATLPFIPVVATPLWMERLRHR
jgi:hypothetical protein